MDGLQPFLNAIDTLGTLGVLVAGLYLVYTGRVKVKKDFDTLAELWAQKFAEQETDAARELAYVEARRLEEREGRIAAEKRVSVLVGTLDEVLVVMRGIKEEVIRGGRQ